MFVFIENQKIGVQKIGVVYMSRERKMKNLIVKNLPELSF